MSTNDAEMPAPAYRSPVQVALDLKKELDAFERDQDRRALVSALRDQFLMNRLVASSKVEAIRDHSLNVLFGRVDKMSDPMLMRLVEKLSSMGALDLETFMGGGGGGGPGGGGPMGNRSGPPPMVSIQQAFGLPPNALPSSLEASGSTNPVKETGMLIEAVEHAARYLRDKGAREQQDNQK